MSEFCTDHCCLSDFPSIQYSVNLIDNLNIRSGSSLTWLTGHLYYASYACLEVWMVEMPQFSCITCIISSRKAVNIGLTFIQTAKKDEPGTETTLGQHIINTLDYVEMQTIYYVPNWLCYCGIEGWIYHVFLFVWSQQNTTWAARDWWQSNKCDINVSSIHSNWKSQVLFSPWAPFAMTIYIISTQEVSPLFINREYIYIIHLLGLIVSQETWQYLHHDF